MAARSSEARWQWSFRPGQLIWRLSDSLRQAKQRRLLTPDAALGRRGEDVAHRYLQRAGFTVIARNYRPGADSEIDIVARQGEITVFVEVKSRTSAEFGSPDRAIDQEKRKHILRAAQSFMTRAGIDWNQVRFDVISVVFSDPPEIDHLQDAFFEGRAV
ncbi:MAG: YraN family protein [Acidobacteriaceae bacterium]|nr:YraN family protein [Acidobacteriaceae bacterium]MBV8572161.1 YraN family protein [Acidobacteriaceae bacterium]